MLIVNLTITIHSNLVMSKMYLNLAVDKLKSKTKIILEILMPITIDNSITSKTGNTHHSDPLQY